MQTDSSNVQGERLAKSGDLAAEVNGLAQPLIDQKQTPGLVVGVLFPDGHTQIFGYGVTGQPDGSKVDGSTLFAVASVSKGFLAEMTALLVQKGVFQWNETLVSLLPAATPLSPDARKITLLQLVTHTSGLPRQMMTTEMLGGMVRYLFTGDNFYQALDRRSLVDYLADFSAPVDRTPRYSNIGYGLLDYILELRTGKTVKTLLAENITGPLKLTHTGYQPSLLPGYARRALGHAGDQPKFVRRGDVVPDWHFSSLMMGAAGLYTNADDLLIYARAHLHPTGYFALDQALRDSLRVSYPRTTEAAANAWIVDEVGQQKITYQVGFIGGFSSYIGLDTRHKTAVVVLQNSFNWTNNIGHKVLQRMGEAIDINQGHNPPSMLPELSVPMMLGVKAGPLPAPTVTHIHQNTLAETRYHQTQHRVKSQALAMP
ncbi:MAG: serine hydrolase [Rouxiella aceris]|uniref:serine hydrolase domain-containing protein n=1 Tax=Rouxiella aceris TaxID=2703884 RepID=UPI00283FD1FB|nr:serine hydrolase domain-containing protein [Rouxiella aceris]MDR3433965.1 serine hydrolase [Rouxiella aceris]